MKQFLVFVATLNVIVEAALLPHFKRPHSVAFLDATLGMNLLKLDTNTTVEQALRLPSLDAPMRKSDTNMTVEQALRVLLPVPSVLKTFLVERLGQNISTLIRISDNHTDAMRSLRGSRKVGNLLQLEQVPPDVEYVPPIDPIKWNNPGDIHALEGSHGAAKMLRELLVETQQK